MLTWIGLLATLAAPLAPPDWSALTDLHGRPVIAPAPPALVVVVGARKARDLRGWEERLVRLDPRPRVLRVVDVPANGRPDDVARTLRRRAPAGVVIAIDGERRVARALELDTGEPHVLVLDAQGRVVARIRGRAGDQAEAAVRAAWKTAAAERAP